MSESFLIFDDLAGILDSKDAWFTNLIAIHRHFKINIVISVQYLTGRNCISTIMREQTTYAIMFHSSRQNTIENLYKAFGNMFPSLKEFKDYFLANTDILEHTAIMYDDN